SAPLCVAEEFITLASTTSTQACGFFDYYLPIFQKETGIEVRVVAVGTGQALKLGENGDADVLLVHDKAGELKFIEEGFGVDRREVMFNDFVFIGPEDDPAEIEGLEDAVSDLKRIAETKSEFISRGDDSGTHRLELRLWKEAGIDPTSAALVWYKEAGAGMGQVLNMLAAGGKAYTISDRATWISFENRAGLALLDEGDPRLFNQYSLILVNPERHPHVKKDQTLKFMDWMTSTEGQEAIGDFKLHDQVLFTPNFQENSE
ncbi:MAG: extracellular solute-binding protein, partial [Methylococcales bacterium]